MHNNKGFPVFPEVYGSCKILCLASDERIRLLCAQLLRTWSPEVLHLVAEELKTAVDDYVEDVKEDLSVIELSLLPEMA